ncbi:T9SS type A sorting domain-containing protein [Flavobacterium litorale]|uniref:T9SS type A sorting domain-containing protein n=1 Tax=Flavobacterium litorale TaxID=2856519 RepID=A0ABX8VCR5_9FLAO|nr:T9SS type A sorting domain-containing protein [Flavobacterium litorale]QYJ68426.1 T9SS type A sorting domain-containing protein [Flavobacterium litorale]
MMKKALLLVASLFTGIISFAQYTTVSVALEPSYTNQVYYKFADNSQTAVATNTWDLAFLRISSMDIGIRVNDSRGIQVFEASDNINDWGTIDVTQEDTWTPVYNSETVWATGAFDNGSATYGWGEYNPATHHVTGSIIFVLKYTDESYKKMIIEDYFGGYTIKYATWSGTEWSEDTTTTILNGSSNNAFNYFSLTTDDTVTVAPEDAEWDIVFGRYYGNIGEDDAPVMYLVTGALHNEATVTVAQIDETGATDENPTMPNDEAYSEDINTVGDDWKSFNMDTFSYDIDPETTFYVKHNDGTVYRMYFTSFGGSSTGNLSFKYKNVSATAGLKALNNNVSFSFYPNPTNDKKITLLYDLKNTVAEKNTVSVYTVAGAKVFETDVTNNTGFYTKQVNLSALPSGMYIVQMQSDNYTTSKKLVIR